MKDRDREKITLIKHKKSSDKVVSNQCPINNLSKMQYKSSIEDKFTLKDKDRYVSVSPINLYDTLVKQTPDNCRYRSNKENKTLHNKKKSCELPGLRKLTSPKKDEP